jgi:hypothetical protein
VLIRFFMRFVAKHPAWKAEYGRQLLHLGTELRAFTQPLAASFGLNLANT